MAKRALITGITGQDGSYLAEYLLSMDYEVHGIVRRVALEDPEGRFARISHLIDRLVLHPASLESYPSIFQVFHKEKFDECYHLAAQSFVAESFSDGFSTMNININGTHYVLAALRELQPECRFYFAGSSEMFGKVEEVPQRESTRFHPRSPYGISKLPDSISLVIIARPTECSPSRECSLITRARVEDTSCIEKDLNGHRTYQAWPCR